MTTSDVERRLTDLLRRRADHAMGRTDTRAELVRLRRRIDARSGDRVPHGLLAGAASLTAAAVMAVAVLYTGPGREDSDTALADPGAEQTAAERVAQRFAVALVEGDRDRAVAPLAEGATLAGDLPGNMSWREYAALKRAWSTESHFQPCQETGTSDYGTNVVCPFDYYSFRSEELGLAPFGDNNVSVVVTNEEVRSFGISYNTESNGEAELYDTIGAWLQEHHSAEWPFLDSTPSTAQTSRWVYLWQQRTAEYVEDVTGG